MVKRNLLFITDQSGPFNVSIIDSFSKVSKEIFRKGAFSKNDLS
jgi:hypothetical protein